MSRTTTHPLWRPALCAVAVTFGFMLAGSSNAQAALPQAVYNDPADDGKTAPDIRKITITDNGDGTIGVVIDLPPDEALSTEAEVDFMVDVDRNRDTGSKGGAEFAVFHDATGAGVGKWNSSTSSWDNAEHHPLSPTFDAGRLTMTVTLADFGLTTFDFYVVSFRGEDMDAAPEYDAFSWPAAAQRPSIQRVQVPGTLLVPKTGKRFTFAPPRMQLESGEWVTAESIDCSLTLRGTRIAGLGPCTWVLQRKYRGKHLKLTYRAVYKGAVWSSSLPVTPA